MPVALGLCILLYFLFKDTKTFLYYDDTTFVVEQECGDLNFRSDADRVALVFYHLVIMFILPLLIMAFCYYRVVVALWRSSKGVLRASQPSRSHHMYVCVHYKPSNTSLPDSSCKPRFNVIFQ